MVTALIESRRLKWEQIKDRIKKLRFGQVKFEVTDRFTIVGMVELIGGV